MPRANSKSKKMATYHLSAKIGQKGKAQAHAAYIAREGKYSEGKRYEDLEATGSGNMPKWAEHNPAEFWKAADDYERANGSAYREFEIALPRELTPEQRLNLVQEFIIKEIGDKHAYQFAIHTPKAALEKGEQPHAHIMYSERIRDGIERDPEKYFKRYNAKNPEKGGSKKFSGGKNPNELKAELLAQRERWATLQNSHLEKAGHTARVDHRSLIEQGITDRQPEKHLGGSGVRNTNAKNKLLDLRMAIAENSQAQSEVWQVIESIRKQKEALDFAAAKTLEFSKIKEISNADNQTFPSFNDFQKSMIDEYEGIESKLPKRGCNKHRLSVSVSTEDDEHILRLAIGRGVGRIDVGTSEGYFNPFTMNLSEFIAADYENEKTLPNGQKYKVTIPIEPNLKLETLSEQPKIKEVSSDFDKLVLAVRARELAKNKAEERQKEKAKQQPAKPTLEVVAPPVKPMNSVEKITQLELLFSDAEIAKINERQANIATKKQQQAEVFDILISQYDWIKPSNPQHLLSKNVGGEKADILNRNGDRSVYLKYDNDKLAIAAKFSSFAEINEEGDAKSIAEEINHKAMDWAKQNAKDPSTLKTDEPKEITTVVPAKQEMTAPEIHNSIPPEVAAKYIQVDNKFCNRKNKEIVMFEDKTSKLETTLNSQDIVIDLVKIATERGWKAIKITGTPEFKREAWLEAETRGLKTIGYQPTDFEKAILNARTGKGEDKPVPAAPPAVEVKQPQQELSEQREKRANEVFLQLSNQIRDHWREVESEKLFSEVREMFAQSKDLKNEEPRRLLGLNEKKWQAWADKWTDLKARHDETRVEANLIKEGKSKQEQVIKPQFERAATKKLQELHPKLYQALVDKAAREQAQAEELKRQQELQRNARAKEREQATQAARQRKRDIGGDLEL